MVDQAEPTQLLKAARGGDNQAVDALFGQVYDDLRRIAHQRLMRHGRGETLSTTALVHETYLRLVDQSRVEWQDQAHFFALASRAMRFILVDYARARSAKKRDGGAGIPLDAIQLAADERAGELLDLDEALATLYRSSERLGRIVEYRFFGGLSYEEIAEVTGCSVPTAKRDWGRARAWLYQTMQGGTEAQG
jgi:RNA polymerase sigma factor (TIGR02999 family)